MARRLAEVLFRLAELGGWPCARWSSRGCYRLCLAGSEVACRLREGEGAQGEGNKDDKPDESKRAPIDGVGGLHASQATTDAR